MSIGETRKQWRLQRRGQGYCSICDAVKATEGMKTCEKCRERCNAWALTDHGRTKRREQHQKLRLRALFHYGHECACCGEDRVQFLALHHKNNDGYAHRKELGYKTVYAWVIARGYPDMFEVLCHNCNCARGWYGYCCNPPQVTHIKLQLSNQI